MSELIEVGERENGEQIELSLHEALRVTLPEVRTAGFRWTLRVPEQPVCSLVKEHFDPPAAPPGGTGKHYWEFRAERAGTAQIVIEYARLWERTSAPARSFSFSVHVT